MDAMLQCFSFEEPNEASDWSTYGQAFGGHTFIYKNDLKHFNLKHNFNSK